MDKKTEKSGNKKKNHCLILVNHTMILVNQTVILKNQTMILSLQAASGKKRAQ